MTIQAPHPEQILDIAIDFGLDLSGDGALVAIAPSRNGGSSGEISRPWVMQRAYTETSAVVPVRVPASWP